LICDKINVTILISTLNTHIYEKLFLVLFLIILIGNRAVSQNTNNVVAISLNKMNVVYAGIDNPLTIAIAGIPSDKIVVTADKGTLSGNNGNYILSLPYLKNDTVKNITITIYFKSPDGNQNEIAKRVLRVKQVPKPEVYFGEKKDGDKITKDELNATDSIKVQMKDFVIDELQYTVKRYKLIFVPRGGNAQPFETKNVVCNSDIKAAFSKAVPGDIIMVYDIYATYPGSNEMRLPCYLSIEVK